MLTLRRLNADEAEHQIAHLIDLLRDAVDSGASREMRESRDFGGFDYHEHPVNY
jgi:hypothetical protein